MESQAAAKGSISTASPVTQPKKAVPGVARNRIQYDHEMTPSEKFALQVVLKAKNALTAMAVHIQEGKGCSPDIVKTSLAIQLAAAELLFV